MARVAYSEILKEKSRISHNLGDRRPCDMVIERVARTRLEKALSEKRREALKPAVVAVSMKEKLTGAGYKETNVSKYSQVFEKALYQRSQERMVNAEIASVYDVVVALVK